MVKDLKQLQSALGDWHDRSVLLQFIAESNDQPEFLAKHLFDRLVERVKKGDLGRPAKDVTSVRVTISESHVARAWYEGPIG